MTTTIQLGRTNQAIRNFVLEDERIVLATRLHWAQLIEPVATAVGSFLLLVLVTTVLQPAFGPDVDRIWWLWAVPAVRALLAVVNWYWEWFVATDKRMLLLTGLITRRVGMMPLAKVTDMSYSRSPLGRVLGYGVFVLESAGQDQAMRTISYVPDPDQSYRTICATIFTPSGEPAREATDGDRSTDEAEPAGGRADPPTPLWERPKLPPIVVPQAPRPRPDGGAQPRTGQETVTEDIPVVVPALDQDPRREAPDQAH